MILAYNKNSCDTGLIILSQKLWIFNFTEGHFTFFFQLSKDVYYSYWIYTRDIFLLIFLSFMNFSHVIIIMLLIPYRTHKSMKILARLTFELIQ